LVLLKEETHIENARSDYNEEELLLLSKKNIDHFGKIYNQQYDSIFRFVLRKTDDDELAADLVSEVFLKAMLAIKRFQYNGVPYQAYLMKIARNEVLAHYHRTKKRMVISIDETNLREILESEVEVKMEADKVISLIDLLDEDEVAILELKFFEGKAFYEIAFILEKNESTVKMRYYRALQKLKEKVSGQ
jgi:RNA polymerase sigma-70 factor, ECF subfamily